MNGIRLNEAFGDTVNWDLIPTIAIDRADVWTNNPVFGLNALGGAINLQMKNGFTYQGLEAEIQGGSFGTFTGDAQYGVQIGDNSVYVAAQGLRTAAGAFNLRPITRGCTLISAGGPTAASFISSPPAQSHRSG